jgi:MSHA biogenesis protein MshI
VKFPFFSHNKSPSVQVGLEIRPDGIALSIAALNKTSGNLELSAFEFMDCKAGQRETVLVDWVKKNDLKGAPAILVMPADQYQMFPVDRPEVEDAELASALQWKIRDMIDYELDDAVIDSFPFPKEASKGRDIVTAVCAKKLIVKGYIDLVHAAGLDLRSIDITELALRNILIALEPTEGSKAILYLKKDAGILVVCKDDLLYFSRRTNFSFEGLNSPSDQQAVLTGLGLEIQRSMDYCESQLRLRPPKALLLVMPETSIPLANMLNGELAVAVQEAEISTLFSDVSQTDKFSTSFVAMGGALRREAH